MANNYLEGDNDDLVRVCEFLAGIGRTEETQAT